jgi:hypothetical protein
MAKSEVVTTKLLTFNKAQKYLAEKGIELSTQQVRNLARTNDLIMAGVQDYTDPVTESTAKVIDASSIDAYVAWRASNPDVARGGRKPNNEKRYSGVFNPDQLARANALLANDGLPTLEIPVRKPRKQELTGEIQSTNGVDAVSSDVDISELELIEVA